MDLMINTTLLGSGRAATVVSVTGELDIATSEGLSQLADNGHAIHDTLLVDLSGCSFMDGVAVRRIMRLSNLLDASGEQVHVAVVAPHGTQLGRVLALAGANGPLALYESREGALIGLDGKPAP